MNRPIGCAVIGYGGMGHWHAERLRARDDFDLRGIYDIKADRCSLAKSEGIKAYGSLDELLADDSIELVTVATYNDVHRDIAVRALDAGKNVISEKPGALSGAQIADMCEAGVRNGRLFTVHHNRRWDSDYLTAKKIFDDNTLGRVFRIEHRVQGSRGIPGDWRGRKEHGGGMVLDWGVHLMDQYLTLCDDRKLLSVYADLTNVTNDEVDDGCYITLKFEGDLTCLIEVATNNFISLPMWYVLGENGSAVIDDWDQNGKIVMVEDWENKDAQPINAGAGLTKTMAPRTDDSIKEFPLPVQDGDWSEFYTNIYDVIRNGAPQTVTHRQIKRCMAALEAVFESAQKDAVIHTEL